MESIYNQKCYITSYNKYRKIYFNQKRDVKINWAKTFSKIKKLSRSKKKIDINTLLHEKKTNYVKKNSKININEKKEYRIFDYKYGEFGNDTEYTKFIIQKYQLNYDRYITNQIELCWELIKYITIYDRDESIIEYNHLLSYMSCQEYRYLKLYIDSKLIPELQKNILSLLAYLDENEHNNIMTHIIFKGRAFYEMVLQDYTVGLFLISNYYPIYNWIEQIILDDLHNLN